MYRCVYIYIYIIEREGEICVFIYIYIYTYIYSRTSTETIFVVQLLISSWVGCPPDRKEVPERLTQGSWLRGVSACGWAVVPEQKGRAMLPRLVPSFLGSFQSRFSVGVGLRS